MCLGRFGLLFEADHPALLIHLDHPEGARLLDGHAQGGDGQGGGLLLVEGHHLAHVHLVDMVGPKMQTCSGSEISMKRRFW